MKYALAKGTIVKGDTCGDCGRKMPHKHGVWGYIPNYDRPLENVEWLCQRCWYKRFPRKAPVIKVPRKEVIRKLPPYDILRYDYVELGLSIREIGQKYGVRNYVNVYRVLKYRATARGEWPLFPKKQKAGHFVQCRFIVEMAFEYTVKQGITMKEFARRVGVRDSAFYDWRSGKVKKMRAEVARRILIEIGEPVPDWMDKIAYERHLARLAS